VIVVGGAASTGATSTGAGGALAASSTIVGTTVMGAGDRGDPQHARHTTLTIAARIGAAVSGSTQTKRRVTSRVIRWQRITLFVALVRERPIAGHIAHEPQALARRRDLSDLLLRRRSVVPSLIDIRLRRTIGAEALRLRWPHSGAGEWRA
jgi:hypothetical protein